MKFLKNIFKKNKIETGADNPILRQKAKKVDKITPAVLDVAQEMTRILRDNKYQAENMVNVGLAAPQIGQSIRMIAFKKWPEQNVLILINPEIIWTSKNKTTMQESCLSLPEAIVPVKRPTKATVKGVDIKGKEIRIKAEGFPARIIQHEIDHLNGILITDYETKEQP